MQLGGVSSCHKGLHAYVMFVLLSTVPTNRTPLREEHIVCCICACGLCARAYNFRVRRYLSEYIETEMVDVTNPGKRRNAGTE